MRLLFTGDSATNVCIPTELRNPTLQRHGGGDGRLSLALCPPDGLVRDGGGVATAWACTKEMKVLLN